MMVGGVRKSQIESANDIHATRKSFVVHALYYMSFMY